MSAAKRGKVGVGSAEVVACCVRVGVRVKRDRERE